MALVYRYTYPTRTRLDLLVDASVHAAGVVWAITRTLEATSLAESVQTLCIALMFLISACYHLTPREDLREPLRRMDHAMIFLVTPAAVTPFGVEAAVPLALLWIIGIAAAVLKLRIGEWDDWTSQTAYLSISALATTILIGQVPVVVLIGSGAWFLLGLAVFNLGRLPYHMAIWHLCVLGGFVVLVG